MDHLRRVCSPLPGPPQRGLGQAALGRKELICQTQAITRAVTSRQGLLAEFTDTLKGGRPQRPGATRFMSYFLSLQNAYANRDKYAALTLSEAWKVRMSCAHSCLCFLWCLAGVSACEQHACATH